ncbi:hypothetical protein KSF_109400 [Reticulibacter mediterranei]|uniref:GAF domain-containing protein n=1 Tax=Reticulibacter mediterranei TaxID=2778369 RepID=A0A8J3NAY4_9CHLR|nr:hypothetical protein [Reticulibacter mediterranei]GHP00893.1 hypothetical protein KSF_109400 [Reticulibacter mediterranei]
MTTVEGDWKVILREVFEKKPSERQRIATEVNTSIRSLYRWTLPKSQGGSDPANPASIRALATAVPPEYQKAMKRELQSAFPHAFTPVELLNLDKTVPDDFIWRIYKTKTDSASTTRRWSVSSLVLKQIIEHLDPDRLGMAAIVGRCLRHPDSSKVEWLFLQAEGQGSHHWINSQLLHHVFAGRESWVGLSIVRGHPLILQSVNLSSPLDPEPMQTTRYFCDADKIKSMAAFPLIRSRCCAGGLLVVSAQEYFFSPTRQQLLEKYVLLLADAFVEQDFFPFDAMQLQIAPAPEQQRVVLKPFQEQVAHFLQTGMTVGVMIPYSQAEETVLSHIQKLLLPEQP